MKETGAWRVVYARVKAIMTLRTSGDRCGTSGLRHRRFSLPAVLAGAVLLLTMLAGASGAGISAYQGTLYFDGAGSSLGGNNYQLTNTAPPAQGAAPAAIQGVTGTGGLATGTYKYVYVVSSGGVSTASQASASAGISSPGNTPMSVSGVPVGADVYRATIPNTTSTGKYIFVGTNAGPTTTYTDANASPSGAVLPQADTRVALGATGYMPFVSGTSFATSSATSAATASASIPATCNGWSVDSSAGFTFPAGTWTINAQIHADTGTGAAAMAAAIWKVDSSGNTISGGTIVPVTDGGSITFNNSYQNVSVSYTTSSATTLDTGERLCVQFWRHQTSTASGGATNRTVWLLAWDPASTISVHPAPNAFATAALSSPADGLHTQTIPTLSATYSDAEGDSGNITLRVCADAGCSSPQSSSPIAANNGDTKSWTPTGLGDGTYYWSARAQDASGLPSSWTAARTFVIDNVAPTTSISSTPPASSNAASGTISFSANESVTGFQCHVDAAAFAPCTSPASYGPLADGSHTFSVKATADLAGNAGTTTSYSWTIDTLPPDTSITSQPSSLSNTASPSFSFSATQPGSTFECNLDGGGFSSCSSPKTYSGVADGAHTFQVRAIDPAGNVDASPSSYAWTIDATAPDTSIGPSKPASLTTATGATFYFGSNEPSTFACSLDGAAFTACSTPKTYSALADGGHTFQVRATDTATNTDASPASYTWTIDTTPPVTSLGPTKPPANTSSGSATFALASNESGSTFECRLDGGAYAACTSPHTYSGLADGAHTFDVRATDQAGNVDTNPASYTWSIDNVAPATPTLGSPADAAMTNAIPQLSASFDDATAGGDTGTVDFRLCSSSAPAGSACAALVQSTTSGTLSSAGTASWTPGALADGTYHWQARATDAAGNQSGWSATRSFQLDTSVPTTPAIASPADGAWVASIKLKATFSKPSFAGTGNLEFRICSDGLCLGVVRSGTSDTLINGGETTWSPATQPGDGLWYWQVRSHDSAGNASPWSTTRVLHLDSVAPGKPVHFNGVVAGDGLTLRWEAPNDTIANYVVFVNGSPWKNFGSTEFEVKMGPFDANDTRTFSVVAVDLAGNVGAMSPVLVGVPSLSGMSWAQALAATSARGLGLKRDVAGFPAVPMFVSSQDPPAPSLAERGGDVSVSLTAPTDAPLAVRVRPGRVSCSRGCVLKLRVELSSAAVVKSRLLRRDGKLVKRSVFGELHAGANTVRVKVPRGLGKGAYRLVLDATGNGRRASASVRVDVE
jgi:Bacterial Ig-like domain